VVHQGELTTSMEMLVYNSGVVLVVVCAGKPVSILVVVCAGKPVSILVVVCADKPVSILQQQQQQQQQHYKCNKDFRRRNQVKFLVDTMHFTLLYLNKIHFGKARTFCPPPFLPHSPFTHSFQLSFFFPLFFLCLFFY